MFKESLRIFKQWLMLDNGTCPVCGKILFQKKAFFCSSCERALPYVREKTCARCGRPLLKEESVCCRHCTGNNPIDAGLCLMHYTKGAKAVIHAIKFHRRQGLGRFMGKQLGKRLIECGMAADCIIPVPLHAVRLEERGYNQSLCVAQGIADVTGLPIAEDCLIRNRNTPHQTGKSEKERLENLQGAFSVANAANLMGKTVLLVDDVLTTGSTLRECANALKQAGAGSVITAVLAARG